MWNSKDVYFISDSTGILASNLGHAMIRQFPEVSFHEELFPFILSREEAEKTLNYILQHSVGRRPLIFSTIMDPEIRRIFDHPEVELFDVFEVFLERLEGSLETRALRVPGFSRQVDTSSMAKRVEAIHFSLEHDDGIRSGEADAAEAILLGVSRTGKTPVCVYLATQMGLKAANFPLTTEYLREYKLPANLSRNARQIVGLTTNPELLHKVREKRYPDSNYAKLTTCRKELQQAEQLFHNYHIPVISTAGRSIEEIATQVTQELGISRKPTD